MTANERRQVVQHAVRWGNNMIVEAIGNHGSVLTDGQRACLCKVTAALSEFMNLPESEARNDRG